MIETISMDALIRLHGGHFFSRDTMRFFNSRVAEQGYRYGDGWLFVTSERYRGEPRLYTVRFINGTSGFVRSISEFQQFKTRITANCFIDGIIRGYIEVPNE